MDNHIHLLLETPRGNLSRFMQSVLTGYTVYFNLRHNRSGHVMQGRYGAQLVEGNEYLLSLSRYIHLNPIHVRGLNSYKLDQKITYLRGYKWSSYRGYIDKRRQTELVDYSPVLAMMECPKSRRLLMYKQFVEAGLAETDADLVRLMKKKPRSIGSSGFVKWIEKEYALLKESMGSGEDVSFRREANLAVSEVVLDAVAEEFRIDRKCLSSLRYRSHARPIAVRLLCRYADMTQRDAGKLLGYRTGSAVNMQLGRMMERLRSDTKLQALLSRLERKLEKATA